ncbi:hypothetical protein VNO78_17155 [Psophocarpus tetragonolobus]|uniref:Uncharacterized protein n=1 Tax=Psophocarpus tetragonolobus TaxID=3891 RepID=A0AAN9SH27_PSOTE
MQDIFVIEILMFICRLEYTKSFIIYKGYVLEYEINCLTEHDIAPIYAFHGFLGPQLDGLYYQYLLKVFFKLDLLLTISQLSIKDHNPTHGRPKAHGQVV